MLPLIESVKLARTGEPEMPQRAGFRAGSSLRLLMRSPGPSFPFFRRFLGWNVKVLRPILGSGPLARRLLDHSSWNRGILSGCQATSETNVKAS